MKTVTVTMKFEFEVEDADDDSIKEALISQIEERIENDELLEGAKLKVVDQEPDEEEEPDFEDDED